MMVDATKTAPAIHRRLRDPASDEDLLLRYREKHDVPAFERLVHRYERELYNYLLRYTGNAELAEDVFQGTFLRVHQKCRTFAKGRRFRPWVYSIATHLAIDALRRAGRRQTVSLDVTHADTTTDGTALIDLVEAATPSPLEEVSLHERREWIHRAVDQLPDHLRVTVILVYFQGLKYRDAAEALDIPLGTVKSRLHMALVKLHEAWEEDHSHSRGENHGS